MPLDIRHYVLYYHTNIVFTDKRNCGCNMLSVIKTLICSSDLIRLFKYASKIYNLDRHISMALTSKQNIDITKYMVSNRILSWHFGMLDIEYLFSTNENCMFDKGVGTTYAYAMATDIASLYKNNEMKRGDKLYYNIIDKISVETAYYIKLLCTLIHENRYKIEQINDTIETIFDTIMKTFVQTQKCNRVNYTYKYNLTHKLFF